MAVKYHNDLIQGSDEWLQARCGLLTASEMKYVLSVQGGGMEIKYRATGSPPIKPTMKKETALAAIAGREGSVAELCFLANVSDGVIRGLIKDGAIERFETEQPLRYSIPADDRAMGHMYELLSQRITGHVEPQYVSDDMLRGQMDEITARDLYREHYADTKTAGFITNDKWGFTIGYSPDDLVGDVGLIECKSRRQKFQVQTICENVATGKAVPDYLIQCQTGMLVAEREWCDLVSYSGGLPLAVIRVEADEAIQTAIVEAATVFERKLADARAVYDATSANLIPTERTKEMEIII